MLCLPIFFSGIHDFEHEGQQAQARKVAATSAGAWSISLGRHGGRGCERITGEGDGGGVGGGGGSSSGGMTYTGSASAGRRNGAGASASFRGSEKRGLRMPSETVLGKRPGTFGA